MQSALTGKTGLVHLVHLVCLVYSVCSLEPEEGEGVAEHFLAARTDYRPDGEPIRILPGAHEAEGGADSFFIAPFIRN